METQFLIANRFKKVGWICISLSILLLIYASCISQTDLPFLDLPVFVVVGNSFLQEVEYFSIINTNVTFTVIALLFMIGGLLVSFSKEKEEDEFIATLRLAAFQWAFLLNYLILIVLFLVVYGNVFLPILMFNMFNIFILFILRFHYLLYKNRN